MNNWNKTFKDSQNQLKHAFVSCKNIHELHVAKNALIGKKSVLNQLFSTLSLEDKQKYSQEWNEFQLQVKKHFEKYLKILVQQKENSQKRQFSLEQSSLFWARQNKIFSLLFKEQPEFQTNIGSAHPLNSLTSKIHTFFHQKNFQYQEAPEIETLNNNFDLLNVPLDHPSRSRSDTFYLNDQNVLRTHATNFTVHQLLQFSQDGKYSSSYHIGNVFRKDTEDSTHNSQFLQLDVCIIERNLGMAHLKQILKDLLQFLLGKNIKMRFRSNYFPFTEPSIEVDVQISDSAGREQKTHQKWIEILGAGIINRSVLNLTNVKEKINVLAFGVGLDRLALIKYGITDIRSLYKNQLQTKQ